MYTGKENFGDGTESHWKADPKLNVGMSSCQAQLLMVKWAFVRNFSMVFKAKRHEILVQLIALKSMEYWS